MSDKTTAAIAAEQQAAEEASAATADMLPAITLDELEQVDLGSVAQDERAPFRIPTTAALTGPSARSPRSAASTTA